MTTITISGKKFEVSVPYKAGHTLTISEAAVLNQTYRENVRNNLAKMVKAYLADGKSHESIQEQVDLYTKTYEFGARAVNPATAAQRETLAAVGAATPNEVKSAMKTRAAIGDASDDELAAVAAFLASRRAKNKKVA